MRRVLPVLLVVVALVLAGCGGDADPDVTAGSDGAFGQADDCTQLADQAVAARARVLRRLGDAGRRDVEAIDAAMETFGGSTDLATRYEGLDCDTSFDEAVCAASADLAPAGPAAEDLVATWAAACP